MGKKILILLNDSDGEFIQITDISTPVNKFPFSIASGDFDLDGDLDLVYSYLDTSLVCILENDGTGDFSFSGNLKVQDMPFCVVAADLDNDSDLDLAVVNHFSNTVSVLLNKKIEDLKR